MKKIPVGNQYAAANWKNLKFWHGLSSQLGVPSQRRASFSRPSYLFEEEEKG